MHKQKTKTKNQITFRLNTKVYPLEAIYSTVYVFSDRTYAYLNGDPAKEITISLEGKEKLTREQLKKLKGEFHNELLNYLLRVEIAKSNQKIREFIVGTALLSALPNQSPVQPETSETASSRNDPLGIAVSWEEKYGKKKAKKKK